ncbi:aspartic peptidase domain-containing protein [Boeremia exigua]|uniref:aspartic peptidase domain-containing protein n=1 Tax=Boeremia exigua TaxID=749465 RepID=UPI001E8D5BE9|nr:aspartic peptidase domain-containing protein [Boeremia exigua]KAH6621856.1 aspartic peptidase domain-containing protein [Boeremia exigua]
MLLSGRCAYTTLLSWTFLSLCSAAYEQKNSTSVPGYTLPRGVESVPVPLTVAPDQGWAGIDGQWNTFTLRVGAQQAVTQVVPSTSSQQIWVVNSEACEVNDTSSSDPQAVKADPDCEYNRGYVFNISQSRSWAAQGYYSLWIGGTYGIEGNGFYGYDAVGLGLPGEEGPAVANTTIGTLRTPEFWLGHLGLHPKSTNFSANLIDTPPVPSYMTRLFKQGNIPSISFGYTAGARYHDAIFLGSLTLGGYDTSRYIPNNASFVFSPDNERELVVGLAGLTAKTTTQSNIDLMANQQDDVVLLIDTTVAELWLPLAICQAFEEAFGLTYDNATQLYLVDDLLHQTLRAQDPSVTLTFHQSFTTNETVQITLPYSAFDMEAQAPYRGLNRTTRYFPLRRAATSNQWTLGRMFLQEAYITVDWERARFSIYQCDWTYGQPSNIVSILSPEYLKAVGGTDLDTGVKVGIAVGCIVLVVMIVSATAGYYWRRRCNTLVAQRRAEAAEIEAARKSSPADTDEAPSSPVSEKGPTVFPKAELPGHSSIQRYELGSGGKEKGSLEVLEADSTERPVYEMLGDVPAPQEAAGRQLSEKETMMVREKMINGFDPHADDQPVSPVGRPAPIASLNDIAMVSARLPGDAVSPVTPRGPRDGALRETFFQLPGRADDLLSPISPLHASPSPTDSSRRRFSYES